MNFYFLLEDEKSFLKVLPLWLEYMDFGCTRVADIHDIKENNYILQSGHGVTQLITKALFDTIETILLNPGKIDKLVVVLDSEELEAEERKEEVNAKIKEHYKIEEPLYVVALRNIKSRSISSSPYSSSSNSSSVVLEMIPSFFISTMLVPASVCALSFAFSDPAPL